MHQPSGDHRSACNPRPAVFLMISQEISQALPHWAFFGTPNGVNLSAQTTDTSFRQARFVVVYQDLTKVSI